MSRLCCAIWIGVLSLPFASIGVAAEAPTEVSMAAVPTSFDDAAILVRRSKNIVVADVQSVQVHDGIREYHATIVETLKGEFRGQLILRLPNGGNSYSQAEEEVDFREVGPLAILDDAARHGELAFWLGASGRAATRLATGFFKGRHLLFLDALNHHFGTEGISGANDPWYLTVKMLIADPSLRGKSIDPIEFVRMFESVYIGECGHPEPHRYPPGKIWGTSYKGEIAWSAVLDNDRLFFPDREGTRAPCSVRKGRSFYYLALFYEAYMPWPIAVIVEDGIVRFDQRYGNLALTYHDIPLETVVRELNSRAQ
jgi:hypothetical protein